MSGTKSSYTIVLVHILKHPTPKVKLVVEKPIHHMKPMPHGSDSWSCKMSILG